MTSQSPFEQILMLLDELEYDEQLRLISFVSERLRDAFKVEPEEAEPERFRQKLPRLPKMFRAGFVRPGDVVYFRDSKGKIHKDKSATLVSGYEVRYGDDTMPINDWARLVSDWKGVRIYDYVILARENRTLGSIHDDYIRQYGYE